MAGTIDGGIKAAEMNKARHGKDFYQKIGSMGGKVKTDKPKGFAALALKDPEKHKAASSKGGTNSSKARAVK